MNSNRRIHPAPSAAGVCGLALLLAFAGCGEYPAPAAKRVETRPDGKDARADRSRTPSEPDEPEIPTTVEPFTLPDKKFAVELAPGIPLEFVGIPAGAFTMGNRATGVRRHRERIAKPFYLGKYEVTQEQWQAVMGNNPSLHKGPPRRPVERVNWDECQAFLRKLNEKFGGTGMCFGLPTEAQWEFACRAGAAVRLDSTDRLDRIADYGWCAANAKLETHPVGEKRANKWGLYDMHGNVAEWCADNATNIADGRAGQSGTAGGEFHAVRGSNWKNSARECFSTARLERRGRVSFRFDGLRVLCAPAK
jgi:formylglycine-generating enzyme required for sulfatase activity